MSDSLETTPYEACYVESIHILQPHQPLGGPLDVFQFGQIGLIFLVTGPEGWTAEGQKVNGGGLGGGLKLSTPDVSVKKAVIIQPCVFSKASLLKRTFSHSDCSRLIKVNATRGFAIAVPGPL